MIKGIHRLFFKLSRNELEEHFIHIKNSILKKKQQKKMNIHNILTPTH